jgi:anti-anti-sigma factor
MNTQNFPFGLHHRTLADTIILEFEGELDVWAEHELAPHVAELLDHTGLDAIVDLRSVTFLDAAGMRLLVNIRNQIAHQQGTLRVVPSTPRVWQAMRITRLEHAFTVLDVYNHKSISAQGTSR